MDFRQITREKERFMELLLLADEQESMVMKYLERGDMYAAYDGGSVCAVCVVTGEDGGVLEIKNLAVEPQHQGKGIGRAFIRFIRERYRGRAEVLRVGTGDSPATLPFYEKCGFSRAFVIPGFFTDNYDHTIIDGGVILRDMIVLEMKL